MGTITLTLDKARLDIPFVHAFLTTSTWAAGISLDRVETSIANSLCVGAYDEARQVGFASPLSAPHPAGYHYRTLAVRKAWLHTGQPA